MQSSFTADQAVRRIQAHFGDAWKGATDGFKAGTPATPITGIATTWAPSIDALQQAVARGQNLVVSMLAPFWAQPAAAGRGARAGGAAAAVPGANVEGTELRQYVSRYIDEHNLVIWRFSENWDALPGQFRLRALANSLGWTGREDPEATKAVGRVNAAVYTVGRTSLMSLVNTLKTRPGINAMRVVGDPNASISRVALRPGYLLVPEAMQLVRDTKVDAVVCGEACEWEAFEYYEDWIAAGMGKAMLMLGYAASEAPGTQEMASWIKSLITEVPVSHIPSGDRFEPLKP